MNYEYENFGTDLTGIFLVDDRLQEIENYLENQYGYISKDHKLEKLGELIERYKDSSEICSAECRKLKEMFDTRQMTKTLEKKLDLLKTGPLICGTELKMS